MTIEIKKNTASTVYINTPETSWALFMFNQDGDLFLSSDWGSYTYRWRGFGENFERFLTGLSVEYFVDKLSKPDVNQHKPHSKQKEILILLAGLFIATLKNQKEDTQSDQIVLNGKLIDESDSFETFLKKVSSHSVKYGVLQKIVHVDNNGFCTTGYDLKNTVKDNVYPVKSYLLTREVEVPKPFKPTSNN